jgi:NADH-quinone oxidoreductase subunit N
LHGSVILLLDLFLSDAGAASLRADACDPARLLPITGYADHGSDIYTFSGMFVNDPMANVLKLGIYVAVAIMLVYSQRTSARATCIAANFSC